MGNLWSYKNYHFKQKFPIVLLQERCEIVQFKFGHPVVKTAHTEKKLRRLVMLLLTKHLYDCRIKTFDNWVLKISKWIWI